MVIVSQEKLWLDNFKIENRQPKNLNIFTVFLVISSKTYKNKNIKYNYNIYVKYKYFTNIYRLLYGF